MAENELIKAIFRHDEQLLKALLSSGIDPNQRDGDGRTPLMHAVIENDISLVKTLLDNEATEINLQDAMGYSALHFAAQDYLEDIGELLLENNAEVDLQDMYGNTPLWRAVFNSNARPKLINALLKHGADKFIKNNSGNSPVDLANKISNYNISDLLGE